MQLTWTCHICGEDRPDECISVHKHPAPDFAQNRPGHTRPHAAIIEEHVRYCNDNPKCAAAAAKHHFFKAHPGTAS